MKISIESYGEKFTFETEHDDVDLDKLHGIWERCLYAMSWTKEAIRDFYPEEEYGECGFN